jgi:hypothetical protein
MCSRLRLDEEKSGLSVEHVRSRPLPGTQITLSLSKGILSLSKDDSECVIEIVLEEVSICG